MWKLSATALLLSSTLFAGQSEKVQEFLEEKFTENPNIISIDVQVVDTVNVKDLKGWDAVVVNLDATVKAKPENRKIKQKMIWFTNGQVITRELTDLNTGLELADMISPSFKAEHYKKENLIYGDENAKHKVAIFSDPLCPFCKDFVPEAINYMKKYPKTFAVYYYHLPLERIHPAAVQLTQAAVAAKLQGYKDVTLKLYEVNVKGREKSTAKILKLFNEEFKTDIKESDLKSKKVKQHLQSDLDIASDLMVNGTPTIFFDGKIDKTKKKYKEAR
ncbi:MAG: DsbA family protein [Campylobacterota bacterium]|nr:DsbA family protein [Campylobacterota bacterium]